MRGHAGVGAHRDPHAGGHRLPERLGVRADDRPRLLDHPLRHLLAALDGVENPVRRHQGRDQPDVVRDHHLDRLVVEVHAVLDGAHPGAQGVLDALRRLRVGHDVGAGGPGNGDDLGDLVGQELRELRVRRRRQHATGRGDLDVVGTRAQDLPSPRAHLLRTVDDAARHPRVGRHVHVDPARHHAVVVPTGLAQQGHRDPHARAFHHAVLDRLLDADIGEAGVADGGDPDVQGATEVSRGGHELVAQAALQRVHPVKVAGHGQVDVAVEQAGQQREAGAVDRGVTVEARTDVHDPLALDEEVRRGDRAVHHVEHLAAGQQSAHALEAIHPVKHSTVAIDG